MATKRYFNLFVIIMSVLTFLNYQISVRAPIDRAEEKAKVEDEKKNGPVRQDERLYAEVLAKTELVDCPDVRDPQGNVFYNCKDGEKITMTKWTRDGGKRSGVVTRWYDSTGKLRLIYGHPDDTF